MKYNAVFLKFMEQEDLEVMPQLFVMIILVLLFAGGVNWTSRFVKSIMVYINDLIFGPRKK